MKAKIYHARIWTNYIDSNEISLSCLLGMPHRIVTWNTSLGRKTVWKKKAKNNNIKPNRLNKI